MKKSEITPAYLYQTLARTRFNLDAALADIEANQKNRTPIYNLDFSLVAPYLFNSNAHGAKPFSPAVRDVTTWVLNHWSHDAPFVMAIGAPLYFEFLDQLQHKAERLNVQSELLNRLRTKDVDKLLESGMSPTTEKILRDLDFLTVDGVETSLLTPARRLRRLFEEGKLQGVGDYLSETPVVPREKVRVQFNEILQEMIRERLPSDASTRSKEASLFHYKIDAANICFALFFGRFLNSENFYVTKEWEQVFHCQKGDAVYARYYATPLFITNVYALRDDSFIKDPLDFAHFAQEHCKSLLSELEPYKKNSNWDGVPGNLVERLLFFYEHTIVRLYSTRVPDTTQKSRRDAEEIRSLLSSRKRFEEAIDRANAGIEEAANLVEIDPDKLGMNQLGDLDILDDPVLKRITDKFKVNI